MIRRPAGMVVVALLASACPAGGDEVPVISGPNLPGAEIITSQGEVTSGEGGTSEATVTTEVKFGPQFIRPSPNGPGGLALLLANFSLGPLSIRVESSPHVATTISNTSDRDVGDVLLESTFAIDGDERSDVVISATSDAGTCSIAGALVSCPLGSIAGSGTTSAVIEVRGASLTEGTVTVTTRVRADVAAETSPTPLPGPEDSPATPR